MKKDHFSVGALSLAGLVAMVAMVIGPSMTASPPGDALRSNTAAGGTYLSEWEDRIFQIADARTFVKFFPVRLSVSDLTVEDGYLVGDYTIKVMLLSSESDHGRIVLPITAGVDHLQNNGGVLEGRYSSRKNSARGSIICKIFPGEKQQLRLTIEAGSRTLDFRSEYTILAN